MNFWEEVLGCRSWVVFVELQLRKGVRAWVLVGYLGLLSQKSEFHANNLGGPPAQ